MINELYALSKSMEKAHVKTESQHPLYGPLPNVSTKAPCIHIVLSGDRVKNLHSLSKENAVELKKYGNNQASYPAMNLAALYRVTDPEQISLLTQLREGKTTEFSLDTLKSWCTEDDWSGKLRSKYQKCLDKGRELHEILSAEPDHPIHTLYAQTERFRDPEVLRKALEQQAFSMLEQKKEIPAAISMLFYAGKADAKKEKDEKGLSVMLDCEALMEEGYSTAGKFFTDRLNQALLSADSESDGDETDAFGNPFQNPREPMPQIKLAGGFTATLRTMFKGQPCQTRYGKIEDASYPICKTLRKELCAALYWLSDAKRQDQTWTMVGEKEILFAYPERFPEISPGFVTLWKKTAVSGNERFEAAARNFLEVLNKAKNPETDSQSGQMQIFILRMLDKAKCKIVYTRSTTAKEVEQCSEVWYRGCQNLPKLKIGNGFPLFPGEVYSILNWNWKQNLTLIQAKKAQKQERFHFYHGLDLFFDGRAMAASDLSVLLRNLEPTAQALGQGSGVNREKFCQSFRLLGLLLDRLGSRKEQYMQSYPYLYGQLLKVSDELHALYCRAVRKDGKVPPQLVGGSLYNSAAEMPVRTMAQLGQRMNPYLLWAKSYRYQKIQTEEKESWRAAWYLRLYEKIASQLAELPAQDVTLRFTDGERAQLLIGYLAAFPKKENENGGMNDEN